jgi:CBS domain-containing protein
MTAPEDILEQGCLMIMGSEGRGEQTVRTDQDNGLLLAKPIAEATLQRFRNDFTAALERFGFPPCLGNVMVRNPVWSQPVDDFIKQLTRWIISPDEMSAMHLGIFADAIAIGRKRELLTRAKSAFFDMMRGESAYLAQFARAIDQFPGAGGVFTALMATVGREEVIDIKKSGIFPIVHGIRTMAIERGIFETSTVKRIEQLAEEGIFASNFARELTGSFRFFLELRLRSQLKAQRLGNLETEAQVRPGELSNVERDLLRDALRVVKEFREIVRSRYHLGLF